MNFRRPNFDFFEMGMKPGEELVAFNHPEIKVIIKDSRNVVYNGQEYKLTTLENNFGISGNPCGNWLYNGKGLNEIYNEYYPKFDEALFTQLLNETEMDPNLHDGSYELVQETVKAYKNVSPEKLNYLDLNCIYLMTVGTWKHSFDKKEETINKSHLNDGDKAHLIEVLRKIQQNAEAGKYQNRESGNPTCGMFGTGFYTFEIKTNDNSVKQFIKLCVDIISEADEEKIFAITEEALKIKINGMQTGSISQILHCLKPNLFPILNGHMRQDSVFTKLCIDIKDQKDSTQYISNCRKIKKFRDENFSFKNYRIMDRIMDRIGINVINANNIWLLSWNEEKWTWNWPEENCDYETWADGTKKGETYSEDWRCSNGNAKIGDEFYVIKTGKDPKGIFAHGIVTKDSYIGSDNTKRVGIEFDLIQNYKKESIIPIQILKDKCPDQEWSPQASGISIKKEYYEIINELWEEIAGGNEVSNQENNRYVELLKENKNIILHGAPGTGKTYLAKEIAEAMGCSKDEIGFCQFHPSYDYTDFVEGLRPTKNNGFERQDGVLKEFCAEAIENLNAYKSSMNHSTSNSVDVHELFSQFANNIEKRLMESESKMLPFSNSMKIKGVSRFKNGEVRSIEIARSIDSPSWQNLTANVFYRDYQNYIDGLIKSYIDIKPLKESRNAFHGNADYLFTLYGLVKEFENSSDFVNITNQKKVSVQTEPKNYVFIIDEINRGELSKIFGELFFSIDPGYRGLDEKGKPKGLVKTQYQNLVDEDDVFADGFYVPKNVYIIGTMNDIDRSVESMDFAMRRRFTFVEVTAEESAVNMNISGEALQKMNAINKVISKMPELGKSYCIGAAYFKDAQDLQMLWDLKISSLVYEYLRGIDNYTDEHKDGEKFDEIKAAYDNPDSVA